MMSINVWPSGVVTTENKSLNLSYQLVGDTRYPKTAVITHEGGDPRIQRLFARYGDDRTLYTDVAFKLECIETIIDLYGAFGRFIAYQFDYNYLMNGLNLDFLEDTIRFITTGKRGYSLHTWRELVVRDPDYIVRTNSVGRWYHLKSNFGIKQDKDLEHYISMWCSQSGGFEDMLYTTWILFGSPVSAKALID